MQVLLNTNYTEGFIFEGDDAIALLQVFDRATAVKMEGYGSARTFEPREVREPPFEIGTFKLIADAEESALIKKLRKDAADAGSRAYKAQQELKKIQEQQCAALKDEVKTLRKKDTEEEVPF